MSVVLVTGAAGFLGSHIVLQLLNEGYSIIALDNLSKGNLKSLTTVEAITSRRLKFIQGDVLDKSLLLDIFKREAVDCVVHLAGLKSVPESISNPIAYYSNNVSGSIALVTAMLSAGVTKLLFSSSATVYGNNPRMPVKESDTKLPAESPYGASKSIVEDFLSNVVASAPMKLGVGVLRYFNPVGAHESGEIGEDSGDFPANIFPRLTRVALGLEPALRIYGSDYPPQDGSGVRDYIHVMDLADGHIKALNFLEKSPGYHVWNLGTGSGTSVLALVAMFEQVTSIKIPVVIFPRRDGDIAACWADVQKANLELGWSATRDVKKMIVDAWTWQKKKPNGYS